MDSSATILAPPLLPGILRRRLPLSATLTKIAVMSLQSLDPDIRPTKLQQSLHDYLTQCAVALDVNITKLPEGESLGIIILLEFACRLRNFSSSECHRN